MGDYGEVKLYYIQSIHLGFHLMSSFVDDATVLCFWHADAHVTSHNSKWVKLRLPLIYCRYGRGLIFTSRYNLCEIIA